MTTSTDSTARFTREVQFAHRQFCNAELCSGRKLTWLWTYSKADIRTNYLPTKYIFTVSTFQLAILLQFNETDTCTFKELQVGTQIAEPLLKNYLVPMVKLKVLLQDRDSYDLNLSRYSCPSIVNDADPVRLQVEEDSSQFEYACSSGAEGRSTRGVASSRRGQEVCVSSNYSPIDEGSKGEYSRVLSARKQLLILPDPQAPGSDTGSDLADLREFLLVTRVVAIDLTIRPNSRQRCQRSRRRSTTY